MITGRRRLVPVRTDTVDVFGSFFPSASSGRILWISDYSQLYSITSPTGPGTLIADGLGSFIASRLGGLLSAFGLFALLPLVVVLVPFAVIGAWVRRRDAAFTPFFVYAVAFFAASGLVFAVHVPHGTDALHDLLPEIAPLGEADRVHLLRLLYERGLADVLSVTRLAVLDANHSGVIVRCRDRTRRFQPSHSVVELRGRTIDAKARLSREGDGRS